jgi:dihydrofolate reductase
MSKIAIIVAVDRNLAIGFQNKLLFWLPNDLKHFKALTIGNTIIMGRKTFESLPNGALPNRRNIVISSNPTLQYANAEVFPSLEAAIKNSDDDKDIYIIGGESIYRQALPLSDELYITEIMDEASEADAFFPTIDPDIWYEKSRENHPVDEKHLYPYSFVNYIRR